VRGRGRLARVLGALLLALPIVALAATHAAHLPRLVMIATAPAKPSAGTGIQKPKGPVRSCYDCHAGSRAAFAKKVVHKPVAKDTAPPAT
jgi:hypothetical protein